MDIDRTAARLSRFVRRVPNYVLEPGQDYDGIPRAIAGLLPENAG